MVTHKLTINDVNETKIMKYKYVHDVTNTSHS